MIERGGESLGCPTCGERMTPTTIHQVQLDRCPRQHGVWCDTDELEQALRRVGQRGVLSAAAPAPPASTPERMRTAVASVRPLVFTVDTPGDVVREVEVRDDVIKIGRLPSAQVHVANDSRVSRMHAIVEVEPDEVTVIDLGSSEGTLVNGVRVNKQSLRSGDELLVGATMLTVRF